MAMGSRLPSAISASGERFLFPDSFALALAKTNAWTLLSGDRELRDLAEEEEVQMPRSTMVARPDVRAQRYRARTTCVLDWARLPLIRDAGFQSRRSANGFSPIRFANRSQYDSLLLN